MALAQIKAPHFTAGVEIDRRGFVVKSAPIVAWMADGMTWAELRAYCSRKGWALTLVDEKEQNAMGKKEIES